MAALSNDQILAAMRSAPKVSGTPSGGVLNQGHEVGFGIPADGENYWFRCDKEMLHKLLHNLRGYGEAAEKARVGQPASADDLAYPYTARDKARIGLGHDGKTVAIQFRTQEGIPVTIAMTRGQASDFVDLLSSELRKPIPTGPRRN